MIKIYYDEFAEMMKISKDGVFIFEGNYWDFDASPFGIEDFLDTIGVECVTETYSYDDEEGDSDEI